MRWHVCSRSPLTFALFHGHGNFFAANRSFVGEMIMVGASVAISGVTKSKDTSLMNDEEIETGFFNMIDATEERLGYDNQEGGVTQQQQQPMGRNRSMGSM